MQSYYPSSFEREMGCTEREWLSWLPRAVREHALTLSAGQAVVAIDGGRLRAALAGAARRGRSRWCACRVWRCSFRFEGVDDAARQRFMRYFDLYMQRGGG